MYRFQKPLKAEDVVIMEVDFVEGGETKRRPCLIIKIEGEIIGRYPIYTFGGQGLKNKSDEQIKFLYPLQDWLGAGLEKESWIDVSKYALVNVRYVNLTRIGQLTKVDHDGLMIFFKGNCYSTKTKIIITQNSSLV